MPSYYDSSKKKPGKAKVVYAEGGQVRRSDPERRESVRKRAAERKKERELEGKADLTRFKERSGMAAVGRTSKRRDTPERMSKGGQLKVKYAEGGQVKRRKRKPKPEEGTTEPKLTTLPNVVSEEWVKQIIKGAPQEKSGGGQLKVTGMGAATRGGNFTRNG